MHIAYVLNHRSRPESVALKLEAKELFQLERAVEAVINDGRFPPETYTVVTGCLAAPLDIKDPS